MALSDDLSRIAQAGSGFAEPGEQLVGVLAAEASPGTLTFVCAFESGDRKSWLALDGDGRPVTSRERVREAVSVSALCELAEESAGGGDLSELRSQLLALRLTEGPAGIEEAESAALQLESTVGSPPRVASPAYLDAVGVACRRLERALGGEGPSPFAAAMQLGLGAVEELARDVEGNYKLELER